ncbi:hypothetical protein T484DRAFT_1634400, partial [Baffinella frigidus]
RTLHCTPYTLHPAPYTLHPTPYTLHPTPYTLHPTPYTLHPPPRRRWPPSGGRRGRRGEGGSRVLGGRGRGTHSNPLPPSLSERVYHK